MTIPTPSQWTSRPRRIVGLMSGTSLDGVDAALIEVRGGIPFDAMHMLAFFTRPYTAEERSRIAELMQPHASLAGLTSGNAWLGELFADAALRVIEKAGLRPGEVDALASHGQTVWHIPPEDGKLGATLQLGEPSVIAERTGVLTVADFRPRDMAAGGQGAPLVPFADYLLFHSATLSSAVQNIGGIGNVSWIPRGGAPSDVIAFDTGPGNMVIDALVHHYSGGAETFDRDGVMAAAGTVDEALLRELMASPYFRQAPPKSTGRELFGAGYARALREQAEARGLMPADVVATATALTAESIARAYRNFLGPIDEIILGGGGSYNPTLRRMLADRLPGMLVKVHEDFGISGEAKEAIAFALLGHATLCGVPANLPAATGASHPVVLGKIVPG
ncbi:MAG: anhydro-N-acetylmuramic acid kinase [Armatimonadota bacterium]